MADNLTRGTVLDFSVDVAEMVSDPAAVVALDPEKVKVLLARTKDDDPQFPVIRVEEGVSGNKFEWTPEIMESAARQVNDEAPVAYLGHIKPEDERWTFPPIQTQWLRAVVTKEPSERQDRKGQMVTTLYVKGYNLPESTVRRYVATGVRLATSWRGKADVLHLKGGIQRPIKFVLDSIDWSRPGKAAMESRLVTVAAEQQEGSEKVEGQDIAGLSLADLKTHNPNLYELAKRDGRDEAQTTIAEMEDAVQQGKNDATLLDKLRELLGIDKDANMVEALTTVVRKVETIGRDGILAEVDRVLLGKIKGDSDEAKEARATIRRLIPVAEMTTEFDGKTPDEVKDGVTKRIDTAFNEDAGVKRLVAAFDGAAPLTSIAEQRGGSDRKVGEKTGVGTVSRQML